MESSVIAAIISVIGAGLLGGFGYSMQRLSAKIDKLDTKIDTKIDKLDTKIDTKIDTLEEGFNARIDGIEARIGRLEEKVDNLAVELRSELSSLKLAVGKIEFTQAQHSAQLEQIMSYGERIGRLERAVFDAET